LAMSSQRTVSLEFADGMLTVRLCDRISFGLIAETESGLRSVLRMPLLPGLLMAAAQNRPIEAHVEARS